LFSEIFANLAIKNPDIQCIGVWGADGLELEKAIYAPSFVDVDLLGAQIADVMAKLSSLTPDWQSMEFCSPQYKAHVFIMTGGFFLIVITSNEQITGKLRYHVNFIRNELIALL